MTLFRMPSPAGSAVPHGLPAGVEDGDIPPSRWEAPGLAVLDPFLYQEPRWCANCAGEQTFVEVYRTEFARLGYCLGCGEEKLVRWTRTNSEVA